MIYTKLYIIFTKFQINIYLLISFESSFIKHFLNYKRFNITRIELFIFINNNV